MAGLRVGQAFGVLLLPGFGFGSSNPQVPGHPTSMCDTVVNRQYLTGSQIGFLFLRKVTYLSKIMSNGLFSEQ